MSQRIPNQTKFERFIREFGVDDLASRLGVDPSALYHWLRGITRPKPEFAASIQQIAHDEGSRLTLDDIYAHARLMRAADPSIAESIERRKLASASR